MSEAMPMTHDLDDSIKVTKAKTPNGYTWFLASHVTLPIHGAGTTESEARASVEAKLETLLNNNDSEERL